MRTILAVFVIAVFFILFLPICLLLMLLRKVNKKLASRISQCIVRVAFRAAMWPGGMKRIVIGTENVPKDTPVLYYPLGEMSEPSAAVRTARFPVSITSAPGWDRHGNSCGGCGTGRRGSNRWCGWCRNTCGPTISGGISLLTAPTGIWRCGRGGWICWPRWRSRMRWPGRRCRWI